MNKSVIIGAIVVLLAAGGYYQFAYKPAQEAAKAPAAEAPAAEAPAAGMEGMSGMEGAAGMEGMSGMEGMAGMEGAAGMDGMAGDAAAALDPANFNADAVIALIDGSSLDDATKTTLKTAVEAAKANPALVADTVAQVKAALGM